MNTVRIFISSPGDVAEERERAKEVIQSLRRRYARKFNLTPVVWEDLPLEPGISFQQGIDLFLENPGVDIAVFILWSRLGSPLGPGILRNDGSLYRSGTEREYDLLIQARAQTREAEGVPRPRMIVYTRQDDAAFLARLRGMKTDEQAEMLSQKKQAESFLLENFQDREAGHNVSAFHPFDRPVTFSQRLRAHLQSILDELAGDIEEVNWDVVKQGPPYLGLNAFQPEHADVFFGREGEILEARNALKHQAANGVAFLLVTGASGSGKSSLVRAGVVPEILAHDTDVRNELWRTLLVTPAELGPDPVLGLLSRLAAPSILPELREQAPSLDKLAADLARDSAGYFEYIFPKAFAAASARLGGSLCVLLVLDQLEELFSRENLGSAVQAAFLGLIEVMARDGRIWVLATVRGDFYQEIQREPILVRLKEGRGQLDILPPGPEALVRLIEEPARMAGLAFEERDGQSLSRRILRDSSSYAELLPLVEFVLLELFECSGGGRLLTHAAYETIGGVEGALRRKAEDAFLAQPEQVRNSLFQVLRALVSVGDETGGGNPVRLRAPLSTFQESTPARRLVDAFIAARLFTALRGEGAADAGVTIAHESLLRVWPRAVKWREGDIDFLRARARIAARMKDGSPLLRGDQLLDIARIFFAVRPEDFGADQRAWIASSIASADAKERQVAKRRLLAFAALSLLTVLAMAGGAWAFHYARLAEIQRAKVMAQIHEASIKAYGSAREAFARNNDSVSGLPYLVEAINYDANNALARDDAASRLIRIPVSLPNCSFRHEDFICSAVFSPDGSRVLTASKDKTARLWNARTGEAIGEPLRHDALIRSAVFSPDGARVLTASDDKTARLWSARTGKAIGEPLCHDTLVRSAVFSPDGSRVLTASDDKIARLWDAATGKTIGEPFRHDATVESAVFSPDGTRVVTASADKTAQVWDAATGKAIGEPLRHDTWVGDAVFSPDGFRVVTTSGDNTARVWDAKTGKAISEPLRHGERIMSAIFSPDGSLVVTASIDKTARLWDGATGKAIGEAMRHDDSVKSAVFSPDGTRVLTVDNGNTARVWDTGTGKIIGEPLRHEGEISAAVFSPDGSRVVTASDDKTARVWDAGTGKAIGEPLRHDGGVYSVVFSPDGSRVVTISDDNTARVWDAGTGKAAIGQSVRHEDSVASAVFSPDGSRVLTASKDRTARVWDVVTGKAIGEPLRHGSWVSSAVFSPNGTRVLSVCDETAGLWDAVTGKAISEPLRHEGVIKAAVFSLDGTRVVTASADKTAQVWDTATGKAIGVPLRHEDLIWSAVFNPDGTRVVTASYDKTAQIWDAGTGKAIGEPLRHEAGVNSAAFSPDGTRVVTASDDKTAQVWDAGTGKAIGKPLRHEDSISSAVFSPNGTRVLTASRKDKTARVWDARTGKAIGEPLRLRGLLNSAVFSPDGSRVLTDALGGTQVWDAETSKAIGKALSHQDFVFSAAFSPDGTRVVTASADKTAQVWDAGTGKAIGEPLRHDARVMGAVFSPDGSRVVTASDDNTARIWEITRDVESQDLQDLLVVLSAQYVSDDGGISIVSLDERLHWRESFLTSRDDGSDSQKIVRWLFADPRKRTLSPHSEITIPEHIENEIDWVFAHPKLNEYHRKIVQSAYELDPAHPLIQLGLAAVEENKTRQEFLKQYALQHLPEDTRIYIKAAGFLRQLNDPERTLLAAERALKIQPDNADALRLKDWAVIKLVRRRD